MNNYEYQLLTIHNDAKRFKNELESFVKTMQGRYNIDDIVQTMDHFISDLEDDIKEYTGNDVRKFSKKLTS